MYITVKNLNSNIQNPSNLFDSFSIFLENEFDYVAMNIQDKDYLENN